MARTPKQEAAIAQRRQRRAAALLACDHLLALSAILLRYRLCKPQTAGFCRRQVNDVRRFVSFNPMATVRQCQLLRNWLNYADRLICQAINEGNTMMRLSRKQMKRLDWPDEVSMLSAEDICPYAEPTRGKRHIYDWVLVNFPYTEHPSMRPCYDQFLIAFYRCFLERVPPQLHGKILPSQLPHTLYPAAEVAEIWREAMRYVGYRC